MKTTLNLIISLIITVSYLSHVYAVTDAELEALERQIEQQELEEKKQKAETDAKRRAEQKRKAEAAAKRKAEQKRKANADEEDKRIADEKRKSDELAVLEAERKHKAEKERLRVKSEKKEKYDNHIKKAATYMEEEKYNQAIGEYEQLLNFFPDDIRANEGIRNAQKLLNTCKEIVGSWQLSHGPTWVINDDNTAYGKWLIFNANGLWECLSAREREFVVSWIGYDGWTLHFKLSEDTNKLNPTRGNKTISGIRIDDIKIDDMKKDSAASTPTL